MCSRRYKTSNSRIIHISLSNQRSYQRQNLVTVPPTRLVVKKVVFSRSCNEHEDTEFHLKITGSARIEAEERKVKATKGEDCNMTLKNNIEGIIIKWAYQIDEVLKKSSEEELNTEGSYPGTYNNSVKYIFFLYYDDISSKRCNEIL